MSRGFLTCMAVAFVFGIASTLIFSNEGQIRKPYSLWAISLKLIGILALIVGVIIQTPAHIKHNLLAGHFAGIKFGPGVDPTPTSCFFYAGVLAFTDGMFPLKIPAIASSHHRTNLPIGLATTAGFLTRWIFCCFASTILLNQDMFPSRVINFALLGTLIYLGIMVFPELIDGQVYIQQLMFYRGSVDLPVSFVLAFLLPWTLASLVHHANTILSLACFFAITVGIMVCYANPFVFLCETVAEACHFETNFRLSLKQMYDGDRLSKKETSILPKASSRGSTSFFDQQSLS